MIDLGRVSEETKGAFVATTLENGIQRKPKP